MAGSPVPAGHTETQQWRLTKQAFPGTRGVTMDGRGVHHMQTMAHQSRSPTYPVHLRSPSEDEKMLSASVHRELVIRTSFAQFVLSVHNPAKTAGLVHQDLS